MAQPSGPCAIAPVHALSPPVLGHPIVIPNEVKNLLFPAAAAAPTEDATGHRRATLLRTVPYQSDLSGSGPVKSVGYLWSGHPCTKGKIENAILQRLVDLAQKPLVFACGYHQCNLGICFFSLAPGQPVFKYLDGLSGLFGNFRPGRRRSILRAKSDSPLHPGSSLPPACGILRRCAQLP